MAIVAAAGTKTNTLDLSQFSRLAHRFSKGEFGDPSGQANDTVLEDGFYEHEFKKPSVGFRVKNVLETGSIVVSKVNDPDLEGLVEVGDTVIAGQTIVVMEAMKMEMSIDATTDGTVTSVHVTEGDAVDAGAPLVVIE